MKKQLLMGLVAAYALTACSAKIESSSGEDLPAPQTVWPEMKTSTVAGQVFGKNWAGKTAVYETSLSDPKMITVRIYGQVLHNACSSGQVMSNEPYATVMLPKDLKKTNYMTDILTGQGSTPMTFTRLMPSVDNLIAEKTKISVQSVSAKGFQALIYAEAYEPGTGLSQVNGAIHVVNCEAPAEFAVWNELIESYDLTQFNGVSVSPIYTRIGWDNSSVYDVTSATYRKMLDIPLYYSVSGGATASYNFGPIEGLGVTTVKDDGIYKTYTYKYSGPVRISGENIQLSLDINVKKSSSSTEVKYTIEVPNHIKKSSHSFVLKKPFQ